MGALLRKSPVVTAKPWNWFAWWPMTGSDGFPQADFIKCFQQSSLLEPRGASSKGRSGPWEGHCRERASVPSTPFPQAPCTPPPAPLAPKTPLPPPCSGHSIKLLLEPPTELAGWQLLAEGKEVTGRGTSGEPSPVCHQVAPLAQDNTGLSRGASGDRGGTISSRPRPSVHLRTSREALPRATCSVLISPRDTVVPGC